MTSQYRVPLLMLTGLTLMTEPVSAVAAQDVAARPAFTWQFEYDAADRITKLTDAANRSITVHYEEDDQGRTTKLTKHFFDGTAVVAVQVVKTEITPQLASADGLRGAETAPLPYGALLHTRR